MSRDKRDRMKVSVAQYNESTRFYAYLGQRRACMRVGDT